MLGECLEVFGSYPEEKREALILNSYTPKDGTYLLVGKDGALLSAADLKLDKKTGEVNKSAVRYRDFCYFDYYSDLISMNKPQDPSKLIHSNNYFSFWIKKESLLDPKLPNAINKYFEILEHPEKKYKNSKEALRIYEQLESEIGAVDAEAVQRNKEWILRYLFRLDELGVHTEGKDYLKIFFEADRAVYRREGNRYFIPNIYNSNQYNVCIQEETLGLPDNNQGMNAKKPFLSVKTRKSIAPYLLNREEVLLQKQFFDYLMTFAAVKKFYVYVDLEQQKFTAYKDSEYPASSVCGFYLRIQKGKEVEIRDQDVVPCFTNRLREPFRYENLLGIEDKEHPEYEFGKTCETLQETEYVIHDLFFSKKLISNYFAEDDEIKKLDPDLGAVKRMLLFSRRKLFGWLRLGNADGIRDVIDRISRELIKDSILNEQTRKAAKQLNLRFSLLRYFKGEENDMADYSVELRENLKAKLCAEAYTGLESDQEYYFAVGQLAKYFVYLSKAGKKKQSLINPFLNAGTDEKLKDLLCRYYKKYNYDISVGAQRVSRLYGMIEGYQTQTPVMQDLISVGFVIDNLLLEKKVKEEKENE